jgi:hypothetical protein
MIQPHVITAIYCLKKKKKCNITVNILQLSAGCTGKLLLLRASQSPAGCWCDDLLSIIVRSRLIDYVDDVGNVC